MERLGKRKPDRHPGFLPGAFPLLLVLALGLLLWAGCAHPKPAVDNTPGQKALDDLRSRVRQEIADPMRARQIVALVDEMEKELDEADRIVLRYREDFRRLNADYEAVPEQFQKLIVDSDMALRKSQQKLVEIHFQIKNLTSPGEWTVLSREERKAFEDALKAHEEKAKAGLDGPRRPGRSI
jgi:hypothetical protein